MWGSACCLQPLCTRERTNPLIQLRRCHTNFSFSMLRAITPMHHIAATSQRTPHRIRSVRPETLEITADLKRHLHNGSQHNHSFADVKLTAQLQSRNPHGLYQVPRGGGLSLLWAFVQMQPLQVLPMPTTHVIDWALHGKGLRFCLKASILLTFCRRKASYTWEKPRQNHDVTNEAILQYIQVRNHFSASQMERQQRKNTHHANDSAGYDILDKLWIEWLLLQLKVMILQIWAPKGAQASDKSIWGQNHNNLRV